MKHISKILCIAGLLCAIACVKEEQVGEPQLEVNRNNISGEWELVEWNGNSLEEGTFFRINLVRNDGTFTIVQNMDAFPEIPREITGRYDLREDEVYGSVISGIYDHEYGLWANDYIVTLKDADSMVWTSVSDPEDVSVYIRAELPEDIQGI